MRRRTAALIATACANYSDERAISHSGGSSSRMNKESSNGSNSCSEDHRIEREIVDQPASLMQANRVSRLCGHERGGDGGKLR